VSGATVGLVLAWLVLALIVVLIVLLANGTTLAVGVRWPTMRQALAGVAIGLATGLVTDVALILLGPLHVTGVDVVGFVTRLPTTILEAFTSHALPIIEFGLITPILVRLVRSPWLAVAIAAILLGVDRALGIAGGAPGAEALPAAVAIWLLAGAAYVLTGRVWMSLGVLGGWTFVDGVFGAAALGLAPTASLFTSDLSGLPLLSGDMPSITVGEAGPQAGLGACVVALVALGLLLRYRPRLEALLLSPG
jgi:uncharacterized protein